MAYFQNTNSTRIISTFQPGQPWRRKCQLLFFFLNVYKINKITVVPEANKQKKSKWIFSRNSTLLFRIYMFYASLNIALLLIIFTKNIHSYPFLGSLSQLTKIHPSLYTCPPLPSAWQLHLNKQKYWRTLRGMPHFWNDINLESFKVQKLFFFFFYQVCHHHISILLCLVHFSS